MRFHHILSLYALDFFRHFNSSSLYLIYSTFIYSLWAMKRKRSKHTHKAHEAMKWSWQRGKQNRGRQALRTSLSLLFERYFYLLRFFDFTLCLIFVSFHSLSGSFTHLYYSLICLYLIIFIFFCVHFHFFNYF